MIGQTLLLLLLATVHTLGAPTQDLSVNSSNDSQLLKSQRSDKDGRAIPLLIYDDGTGTSNLAPSPKAGEGRFSSDKESRAAEASLIQSLMNPLNFNSENQAGVRGLGGLQLPGLGNFVLSPNRTVGTGVQSNILNMIQQLQNLLSRFPFLGTFPGSSQVRNIQSRIDSSQGVYLFTPPTGLIPINNVTPRVKAARQGSSQPLTVELLQNIYDTVEQSLLEQQGLALQKNSLYGYPWPAMFPFDTQSYNQFQFNQPPYSLQSYGPFSYLSASPGYPLNSPFPSAAVQYPYYPSDEMAKPAASELPFKLLKEVTLDELSELLTEQNQSEVPEAIPEKPELKKDAESKTKIPGITSEDSLKMNHEKGMDANISDQHGGDGPGSGNDGLSQVRENSKFAQKFPRRSDNVYYHNSAESMIGPQWGGASSFRRAPLFNSYVLNRSL